MTKSEFIMDICNEGLGDQATVTEPGYVTSPCMTGCFLEGSSWVVYENDEKGNHCDILRTESEDEAFQTLFDYLVGKNL